MTPDGRVRLIATDLDGTLLRSDHSISPRTRAAVRAAHEAGIEVVAATGRGHRSARPLLASVPEVRTAVLSNGSMIRDLHGGEIVATFTVGDPFAALVARVRDAVPGVGLAWEDSQSFGYDHAYMAIRRKELEDFPADRTVPPDDGSDILKLLVCHPTLDESTLYGLLRDVVGDEVTITSSGGQLVEITGRGVHKAAALGALCASRGIEARHVVAIGDNHNDATMLTWAGHGVAVANAQSAVIDAADSVTAHHEDDGVADVIERCLG